eukprot:401743_1
MTHNNGEIADDEKHVKWRELMNHNTPSIRDHIINIGSSIFYSSDYDRGHRGIVKYDTKQNKINIYKYKHHQCVSLIMNHSMVNHTNNLYLINGYAGEIIKVNLLNETFKKIKEIPQIGWYPSSVMANEQIHICGGRFNNGQYIIYSPKSNKIICIKDKYSIRITNQSVLKYNNKLIRFGGLECDS